MCNGESLSWMEPIISIDSFFNNAVSRKFATTIDIYIRESTFEIENVDHIIFTSYWSNIYAQCFCSGMELCKNQYIILPGIQYTLI